MNLRIRVAFGSVRVAFGSCSGRVRVVKRSTCDMRYQESRESRYFRIANEGEPELVLRSVSNRVFSTTARIVIISRPCEAYRPGSINIYLCFVPIIENYAARIASKEFIRLLGAEDRNLFVSAASRYVIATQPGTLCPLFRIRLQRVSLTG